MKYKQSLIDKVLKRDLQPNNFNVTKPAGKPRNDKNGKERTADGVAKKDRD